MLGNERKLGKTLPLRRNSVVCHELLNEFLGSEVATLYYLIILTHASLLVGDLMPYAKT